MIHKFAEITGVTVEEIKSRKRTPEIAEARFVYWKLRFEKHGYSYSAIGRETNRTHATVAHGVRRANDLISMRDRRTIKIWELIKDIEE